LQETFLHTLAALTGASLSRVRKELEEVPSFEKAQDLLYGTFREDPTSRPVSANFVLLQSIILMILESDSRGPENFRGQNGIPKTVLMDAAHSLAYFIAKLQGQLRTANTEDKDLDSDGNITRRNWVVMLLLSRVHSLSIAVPDHFGFHEAATQEDRHVFNIVTLQLARKL
jgi:hypothetical protein